MQYKINISIEREDGAEIGRTYEYKLDKDYQEVVEEIINTLEKEF